MEDVSRFILNPNLGALLYPPEVKQKQWIIQSRQVSYQAWLCMTELSASYLRLCFATEGHSCVSFNYWWSYGFFIHRLSPCHQTQWIKWCEGMGAFFIAVAGLFQLDCTTLKAASLSGQFKDTETYFCITWQQNTDTSARIFSPLIFLDFFLFE